jgi:hypothetical protein
MQRLIWLKEISEIAKGNFLPQINADWKLR